jgi:MFS family permease
LRLIKFAVWSYSAFFIFTAPISEDLGVPFAQQSWVITAYAVTFGAFLLLWGRVADLYSAKPVFCYGFLGLGVMNLIISFLPDRYSFFVLRAISGIFGACLIPAAFRLIVAVFEPDELGKGEYHRHLRYFRRLTTFFPSSFHLVWYVRCSCQC